MLKFAIALSALGRAEEGRQAVLSILSEFGITQTGGGLATMTFTASEEGFARAFDAVSPMPETEKRHEATVGASGPYQEPEITIPKRLEPYVEYVSVTPPARHFDGRF